MSTISTICIALAMLCMTPAIGKVYGQNRGTLITLAGLLAARKKPTVWAVVAHATLIAVSTGAYVAYQYWH